jgi:branched-chain amino acid aminotransferase
MKAYLDSAGSVRLFRPSLNVARFNRSASRLAMPNVDMDDFLYCLGKMVLLDKHCIPNSSDQHSLYIRPTMISTNPVLGVFPSKMARLFVITSPSGAYFPTGFKAISLFASSSYVRAWPGGAGSAKVGGNYAPTLRVAQTAQQFGCSQVLWLLDGYCQEVGTMNIFFMIRNSDNKLELITPPLDGCILPGVTRQSILDLARHWDDFKVSERPLAIREVVRLSRAGRIVEAFGAGTAATVCPIDRIRFEGEDYMIPLDADDPEAGAGPVTHRFYSALSEIQRGRSTDFPVTPDGEWSVPIEPIVEAVDAHLE